jgi:outer membrane protein assembly factor BamB
LLQFLSVFPKPTLIFHAETQPNVAFRNKKRPSGCTLVVFTVVALLLLCPLSIVVYADSASQNWTMYRFNAAHTGYTPDQAPIAVPSQLWNFTINPDSSFVPSPVVLVNDRLFVGSANGVYCFDAATGAQKWRSLSSDFAASTPAVSNERAFAAATDGYLYCFGADSGAELWRFSTTPQSAPASSPTVVGDHVYIQSGNGIVYCIDVADGAEVWRFSTGSAALDSSPTVDDGFVYVGSDEGMVYCLAASDGTEVWTFATGGRVRSPAVEAGFVYVGSADGNAYCLRASDGAKVWNYTTPYNSAGPAHGYHWGNTVSEPAVAEGKVFVGSSNFQIYCLDAADGAKIWNYTTNASVYSAPAVAGSAVLVGSYDGNLHCLNASDGSEMWRYPAGVFSPVNAGGSAGSPAVADGVVYVVGNGVLYALGSQTVQSSSVPFELIVAILVIAAVIVAGALVFLRRRKKAPNKESCLGGL